MRRRRSWLVVGLSLAVAYGAIELCSWATRARETGTTLHEGASGVERRIASVVAHVSVRTPSIELVHEPFERVTTRAGNVILIPADCLPWRGSYDVILHFHGVHTALEPALAASGLAAVLVITQDGTSAHAYSQKYQFEYALPWLLHGVQRVMSEQCPMPGRRVGRVALSAWSAGFAAIQKILGYPQHLDRVDAVLLADGLHARLSGRGALSTPDLRPFLDFAREAVAGRKLMAITHSAIATDGYASTTQTAAYLLAQLGLTRSDSARTSNAFGMMQSYSAHRGSFYLSGYEGTSRSDHVDHQRGMGVTLLPLLRTWWSAQ